jgi:uncharacterized coiled-coil protein SlyX
MQFVALLPTKENKTMQFVHSAQKWTPFFMTMIERLINEQRILNHRLIDLTLKVVLQKSTIDGLVALVDELRQPYNNSKRHDLYELATNKLNELEDRGLIGIEDEPCVLTSPDKNSKPSSTDSKV